MLYFVRESTRLIALTVPIPMLENGSFRVHNRLVVMVLQYFYSTLLYLLEFLARNRQAEFPPQRFLTKSFLTARKTRQKQIELWVGLKIGPTTFQTKILSVKRSRQNTKCLVLDLSVLNVCNSNTSTLHMKESVTN